MVRVWPDDRPADPDIWLDDADLVRYDDLGNALTLGSARDMERWPADARDEGMRPNERSAGGLALVPRSRAVKLVPSDATGPSAGRLPLRGGLVDAPCFYEAESEATGLLITYWFFFPTSTTPANHFTQMLPMVLDAMRKGELAPEDFPPVAVPAPRGVKDRFWEWVERSSPFGRDLVRSARSIGTLGTFAAALPVQALGLDGTVLIRQLDPRLQDLIASVYVHEGDWEGISVRLSQSMTIHEVIYWAHGKPIVDPHPTLRLEDGVNRIIVSVAGGSHACGRVETDGTAPPAAGLAQRLQSEVFPGSGAAVWRTWDHLRPARSQPWYGFGGAWGRPRLPPVGSLDRRRLGSLDIWVESTGPLGPGPLKLARNRRAAAVPVPITEAAPS